MSSLAATQADGYYVPPEYFESGQYKKKSKNQFAGSKGHNQYLQKGVVRFELPYKGVCGKCQESIARGTRFNAQKVKTEESYFTTPIWEFRLSCRKCQHPWRIRTNPKERGFDFVEGASIQAGQEDVVQAPAVDMTSNDVVTNLDRLESIARGERNTKTEIEQLQAIQQLNANTTRQDSDLNAVIRKEFRGDRKLRRLKKQEVAKIGWRDGMQWLNTSVDDHVAAKAAVYGKAHTTEQKRFDKVRKSSIFETTAKRKRKRSATPTAVVDPVISLENVCSQVNTSSSSSRKASSVKGAVSSSRSKPKQRIKLPGLPTITASVHPSVETAVGAGTPSAGLEDMLAGYGSTDDESNLAST